MTRRTLARTYPPSVNKPPVSIGTQLDWMPITPRTGSLFFHAPEHNGTHSLGRIPQLPSLRQKLASQKQIGKLSSNSYRSALSEIEPARSVDVVVKIEGRMALEYWSNWRFEMNANTVIWLARRPGKWLIHCHIPHHTSNSNVETQGAGGLMLVIDVSET